MTAKVSVCLITYNHERFIAQCVEAALMQETDEPFEIIIGEDCSTDHTREVLLQIKERHPERIRMLLRTCRVGGRRNFLETLRACEGEYIAFLDGDDYWTSRRKLQRQVDLLDGRPDVALCGHGYEIRHEDCDGAEQGDLFGPLQER